MQVPNEFLALTRDIIAAIRQFEGLLCEEADALEDPARGGLLELAERKTRYADHLDALVRRRARLLANLGVVEGNESQLEEVFAGSHQARQLTQDWKAAIASLQQCKHMNDIAGATISAQTRYFARGLDIIHGTGTASSYGPAGNFDPEPAVKQIGTA